MPRENCCYRPDCGKQDVTHNLRLRHFLAGAENGTTTTYDSENEDQEEEIAAVAGGLGAVSLTTVADYSVEDADLAGYGLDEASRITVEATYTKNEDEKTMKMYIGSDDGNGNRYVMLDGSKIVYQISDEVCKNILNQE